MCFLQRKLASIFHPVQALKSDYGYKEAWEVPDQREKVSYGGAVDGSSDFGCWWTSGDLGGGLPDGKWRPVAAVSQVSF